jgi:hypothetical protein
MTSWRDRLLYLTFFLISALALPAVCPAIDDVENIPGYTGIFKGDLPEIRKRKVIRALVTYSKTFYFLQNGRQRGWF